MRIVRKRVADGSFEFTDSRGQRVSDRAVLDYIQSLVIPPAYDPVTIFVEKNPKILFEGMDSKGRKQQIYSPQWVKKSTKKKFHLLIEFGQVLPRIHRDIDRYLKQRRMDFHKCVAIVLKIISMCYFRVGHLKYEKLYGSHGISTLKKRHLRFDASGLHIQFIGKKAQVNHCHVLEPEIIELLREVARDKGPEDFLFSFPRDGETTVITAVEINNFLKEYNKSFTSKMFRTFDTNTMLIDFVKKLGDPNRFTPAQRKKNIVAAMKAISDMVNNTPAICRKSYANADLIALYLESPVAFRRRFFKAQSARQLFVDFLLEQSK